MLLMHNPKLLVNHGVFLLCAANTILCNNVCSSAFCPRSGQIWYPINIYILALLLYNYQLGDMNHLKS